MKSVLISIQPKGCENIANGKKTIEVKKTRPKIKTPFKCYIYCTNTPKYHHLYNLTKYNNGEMLLSVTEHNKHSLVPKGYLNGKVIGEFVCDELIQYNYDRYFQEYFVAGYIGAYMPLREMRLTQEGLYEYGKGKTLYGWRISNLKIYDEPKELSDFYKPCPTEQKGNCYGCYYLADRDYGGICANNLTRPPQSWCYVEEC